MPQLLFAMQVLQALPALLAAGQNVMALVQSTNAALDRMNKENRGPSDLEWNELNQTIADLRKALHSA